LNAATGACARPNAYRRLRLESCNPIERNAIQTKSSTAWTFQVLAMELSSCIQKHFRRDSRKAGSV
jgi:hypothetical protein